MKRLGYDPKTHPIFRVDQRHGPELHREAVDLRDIIAEAGETGELLAEHAGVGMEIRLPPQPVVVSVDRSRVRQLALNLIENAVKYTPRGGQVSVELGSNDGRAVFTVADTGIGIALGDLPHVFDRFWRNRFSRRWAWLDSLNCELSTSISACLA